MPGHVDLGAFSTTPRNVPHVGISGHLKEDAEPTEDDALSSSVSQ
jgi:hypothetical protein